MTEQLHVKVSPARMAQLVDDSRQAGYSGLAEYLAHVVEQTYATAGAQPTRITVAQVSESYCERCGLPGAVPHTLTVAVDRGWRNDRGDDELHPPAGFWLCDFCFGVGQEQEPIEDVDDFLNAAR